MAGDPYEVQLPKTSIPLISTYYRYVENIQALDKIEKILANSEFGFAWTFNPQFIDAMCYKGCFPMALPAFQGKYVMAVKLHQGRCILTDFEKLHVGKSVRKKSKKYEFSIDKAYDQVVKMCVSKHGENWLCAPLRAAFKEIHENRNKYKVRIYSVEVWSNGTLVAGELGFTMGSIYTSLTGAYLEDGTGSIQLAALGKFLQKSGITIWDFGMSMTYKQELGASTVPRAQWLSLVTKYRDNPITLSCERMNAQTLIVGEKSNKKEEKEGQEEDGKEENKDEKDGKEESQPKPEKKKKKKVNPHFEHQGEKNQTEGSTPTQQSKKKKKSNNLKEKSESITKEGNKKDEQK